jgi:hypothetical protein
MVKTSALTGNGISLENILLVHKNGRYLKLHLLKLPTSFIFAALY